MRVFTTCRRAFTTMCYLVGFIIVATCIVNTFVAIFQCWPIGYAWQINGGEGNCIDFVAFQRFMAIPNIVTGAIMLVMPLPLVWQLKVATPVKVALTATFLHGTMYALAQKEACIKRMADKLA